MKKWEEKSNFEILSEIKTMQEEHEAVKREINILLTKLDSIEKDFNDANSVLLDRLKV